MTGDGCSRYSPRFLSRKTVLRPGSETDVGLTCIPSFYRDCLDACWLTQHPLVVCSISIERDRWQKALVGVVSCRPPGTGNLCDPKSATHSGTDRCEPGSSSWQGKLRQSRVPVGGSVYWEVHTRTCAHVHMSLGLRLGCGSSRGGRNWTVSVLCLVPANLPGQALPCPWQ